MTDPDLQVELYKTIKVYKITARPIFLVYIFCFMPDLHPCHSIVRYVPGDIKGWIIHKQTAFAPRVVFLEHTHSTTQHWSLPVPIALAHLPNGLRTEPSQNISKLVPKQRLPRRNQGVCGREPLFLCNRVSKVLFYKVALHDSYVFKWCFKACLRTAPPIK